MFIPSVLVEKVPIRFARKNERGMRVLFVLVWNSHADAGATFVSERELSLEFEGDHLYAAGSVEFHISRFLGQVDGVASLVPGILTDSVGAKRANGAVPIL
jgi:hypothetical protein